MKNLLNIKKYLKAHWKGFLILFLIISGLACAIYGLLFPQIIEVEIVSFAWERSINIEEYKTLSESDWTLPSNARLKSSQSEIRYYEQVIDHYDTETYTEQIISGYESYVSGYQDLGNGCFQEIMGNRPIYSTETKTRQVPVYRSVPIYEPKYYYEIDKFVHIRDIKTSGEDHSPFWGEAPSANPKLTIGVERENGRKEKYFVFIFGKDQKFSMDYSDWISLEPNQVITCEISMGKLTIKNKEEKI